MTIYNFLEEAQDLEKYNQRYFDPESLKGGLSVELEGTLSREVFDLIMGKPPEQEQREITMVAKIVDDQPAHEAARPPRRTRRRVRRYRRWPTGTTRSRWTSWGDHFESRVGNVVDFSAWLSEQYLSDDFVEALKNNDKYTLIELINEYNWQLEEEDE